MLKKLQAKWKVNSRDFFWIIISFAVTGTVTAWVSKAITSWVAVEKYSFSWWALKAAVLILGYQIFLLFFGFCFGRFWFFWRYEKKLLTKLGIMKKQEVKARLAIFASGAGTNAEKIIQHFSRNPAIMVSLLVCNKKTAGVFGVADKYHIPKNLISKDELNRPAFLQILQNEKIDWIILAGFLLKIPPGLVAAFPNRIINLHPALLPAYGGEGMYGSHVHKVVLQNKDKETGITIHYVDDLYDHGEIIAQFRCSVEDDDSVESLAARIHEIEHEHFATTIEKLVTNAK